MKHLITGGGGFLGGYLARELLARGDSVRLYDLRFPDPPAGAEVREGDILDREKLSAACVGVDAVHHLVGLMPQSRASETRMHEINVGGTEVALIGAAAAGVQRFVFLSSMEVYGYPERAPFDEDCPSRPENVYGRNKVEAEELCRRYQAGRGLSCVSLRPSTLVGPGINEPTILQLLDMVDRPPPIFPLPASGRSRFQMTAVSDCADACIRAAAATGVTGAFNLGAPGTLTMREQIAEIFSRLDKRPPRFLPLPSRLSRVALLAAYKLGLSQLEPDHIKLLDTDMVMDTSRAAAALGHVSQKTNVDMFLEIYQWRKGKSQE